MYKNDFISKSLQARLFIIIMWPTSHNILTDKRVYTYITDFTAPVKECSRESTKDTKLTRKSTSLWQQGKRYVKNDIPE